VLENQLFAPALKGVIDFDCTELALRSRFFAPEELDKVKINKSMLLITDTYKIKYYNNENH
jgi:hypothetical protein